MSSSPSSSALSTPQIVFILLSGCLVAMVSFGPRSTFGLFTDPVVFSQNISISAFSFALAIQNLLWGIAQPFAGGLADRYGVRPVLCVGALLYALGLYISSVATEPLLFGLGAGVFIGLGLASSSFNLVLGAFGKILPEHWRSTAFGLGTAAGSMGQFLFSPIGAMLIVAYGYQTTMVIFAAVLLLILPLSLAFVRPQRQKASDLNNDASPFAADDRSVWQVIRSAFQHRSYVLLVLGFFVCGFHVAFITVHLPKYLVDGGLDVQTGGYVLALIGLFNMIGSFTAGRLSDRFSKAYLLSFIYFSRALITVWFISVPLSDVSAMVFGAVMGVLWLSTVPPTFGLVGKMFGSQWIGLLYGFAFLNHQIGAFLGLVIGGVARDITGSYLIVWALSIALAVSAALIHLPIRETRAPNAFGVSG